MSIRFGPIRFAVVIAWLILLFGCGKGSGEYSPDRTSSPTGPSSLVVPSVVTDSTAGLAEKGPRDGAEKSSRDVMVNMMDACDPETFNAALGAGTCLRAGGVTFEHFIAQLRRFGFIGAWHFAPPKVNARVGQRFLVTNHGGEVHTFTEVEEFGGGIVAMLNDLAHVPKVAPECTTLDPDDFVAPGATYREDIEEEGVEHYQCCIHPWMRLEARVSEK
jgi:plastocyanin